MMKTAKMIIIIVFSLILSSCASTGENAQDLILAPNSTISPIEGKWEITSIIYKLGGPLSEDTSDYIGQTALFHRDAVLIGNDYSTEPSYKIKRVKASDYLIYKFKTSPLSMGLSNEELEVVTILSDSKYFCELLLLDDDTMLYYKDDIFYKLEKKVAKVSLDEVNRYIDIEEIVQSSFGEIEAEELESGLLLGVKTQVFDEDNDLPDWEYRTYWIQSDGRQLKGVSVLDGILMPRKNGFWKIEQNRLKENGKISDDIIATPLFNLQKSEQILQDYTFNQEEKNYFTFEKDEKSTPSILRNIVFLGNDYISVENYDLDRGDRRTLQIYAVDNLTEKKPIKLSDLIGESGTNLFTEGARSVISLDKDILLNEENVGLARRNGYWTLKGRINYKENNEELYREFNIKAIPPKEMVNFDEQSLPFEAVRLAIPDVLDVFSSPNDDLIVVISTSHIVIYSIDGYDLINKPLAFIELPSDSVVIMSEWATGRYPDIWRNEMNRQGATELD
ncbi:MAG: hypothetical protein RBT15_00855 [Gudongella sp.]|nr:hypothetical protein [Gudongella sp.]